MRILFQACLICLGLGFGATCLGASAPETPMRPAIDTYHGVRVEDAYRWLEDWQDPAVRAWSENQNAHARSVLDAIPQAHALRRRITEIMSAPATSYDQLSFRGGRLFALKNQPPKQQSFLITLASPDRPEQARVLVDPNVLDPQGMTTIDWYVPSHDGRLVAVSLSQGGSEAGDLHVFDVATGKQVFERIAQVQVGTAGGSVAWLPGSRAFLYTRYPRGQDKDFHGQLYLHTLGTPIERDSYEIGRDFPRIAEIEAVTTPEGVALVSMQKGDGGEFQHYVRSLDGRWRQLSRYEDRVAKAVLGRSTDGRTTPVYLISRKDAPRGELLKLVIENGSGKGADLARATTLVPETKDALVATFRFDHLLATDTRLFVTYQLGGPSEIRVFDLAGKPLAGPKQFPIGATGSIVRAAPHGDAVLFSNLSYVEPPAWLAFDPAAGATARTALSQTSPVDFSNYEVIRETATSKDGTPIPLNIMRRKGIELDGSHPTLLTGYGGFTFSRTPSFHAKRRVLLERGVVFAEANLRGGTEFGGQWHREGSRTLKQNVFDDFFAAIGHMIDAGYTRRERLAIEGGSNGGLLMGAMLTQHPDWIKCVVSHVGIYDMLRYESSPNGEFNTPEYGTVKDAAQFEALYAYSPYHRVGKAKYPPSLFLTGANDPRVDPMQSRKMTARLQAAGATVLLRTSANSGHGAGTSLSGQIEQAVDVYAFLFRQLGIDYE